MSFCTTINCMDGRTQLPINAYLRAKLGVEYVDTVTEPGPVRILAEEPDSALAQSIRARVDISTKKHGSKCIALVAHADCAGNPASYDKQKEQLVKGVDFLKNHYPGVAVSGLWVNEQWSVSEVIPANI